MFGPCTSDDGVDKATEAAAVVGTQNSTTTFSARYDRARLGLETIVGALAHMKIHPQLTHASRACRRSNHRTTRSMTRDHCDAQARMRPIAFTATRRISRSSRSQAKCVLVIDDGATMSEIIVDTILNF
jgi:hypothetical protein